MVDRRKRPLRIGCATGRPDDLSVSPLRNKELCVRMTSDVHDKAAKSVVVLVSCEDARRLFNWLGVWLHRP